MPGFGVQSYGWTLRTSSRISPNHTNFHWPKVCDDTLADSTFGRGRKDARNVEPTYYFQIQARLFPTFPQFSAIQTAPVSPVLDGFCVSIDLRPDVLGNRCPPDLRGSCVTALRKLTEASLMDSIC